MISNDLLGTDPFGELFKNWRSSSIPWAVLGPEVGCDEAFPVVFDPAVASVVPVVDAGCDHAQISGSIALGVVDSIKLHPFSVPAFEGDNVFEEGFAVVQGLVDADTSRSVEFIGLMLGVVAAAHECAVSTDPAIAEVGIGDDSGVSVVTLVTSFPGVGASARIALGCAPTEYRIKGIERSAILFSALASDDHAENASAL